MSTTYPLARDGVFMTVQGEGLLLGEPTVFVRLGGCPVGCKECDTDYTTVERADATEIARRAAAVASSGCKWVWITGGEPAVYDLRELCATIRRGGFRIAVATSGVREIGPLGSAAGGPDFLSVSPHRLDDSWVVRRGDQVNVVPGLNGLTLAAVEAADNERHFAGFPTRFMTPLYGTDPAAVTAWVLRRPGWRVGHQAHRCWGVA